MKKRKFQKCKAVLMVASAASMIDQFNIPNIKLLIEMGYHVDVAVNFVHGSTCDDKKIEELLKMLDKLSADCYQIDFDRKITNVAAAVRALRQLDEIVKGKAVPLNHIRHYHINPENGAAYAFIHCHSPIGGAAGRIIARKHKIKTVYTAHGFHFYQGAPKKNWVLFYPAEKLLSRITDILITVNKEDFRRAAKEFHAKKTVYIPGVGVDIERFRIEKTGNPQLNPDSIRRKLAEKYGFSADAFILLSVGELHKRKNHKVVLEALYKLNNPEIVYLLAGQGEQEMNYKKLVKTWGLEKNVKFLGFQREVEELYRAADCFVHPSLREGFGIAPMEAMASGLPLISADINGMKDYTENGRTGICVCPTSVKEMTKAVSRMYADSEFRKKCGAFNSCRAMDYSMEKSSRVMRGVYSKIG